jgi:hypothetical protein
MFQDFVAVHSPKRPLLGLAALAWLVIAGWPMPSLASNQGRVGVNLGATSFMDGFGRPTEGFTYQGYLTYALGRSINDLNGNEVKAFVDPQIDSFNFTNQLSYYFPTTWFGDAVRPAVNFLWPLVVFNTSFGAGGPSLKDNGIGLGDLTMGPMLQFKPIMSGDRPVFSHRMELDLIAPIGKYDPSKSINQGSNFVSISPSWAITVVPLPGFEISTRLHYIYNMNNNRPVGAPTDPANPPNKLEIDSAQGGQAFFFNYAASYEIFKTVHIGASGYFLTQLTADKYTLKDGTKKDGVALGEGKTQLLGIGPGAFWEPAKTDKLFANVYFQPIAKSRTQNTSFGLRWVHSF